MRLLLIASSKHHFSHCILYFSYGTALVIMVTEGANGIENVVKYIF